MYKKILIPIDNSKYSNYCADIGVSIAERYGSQLVASHVFSACLHDRRFKDMEIGLPEHYQEEERLMKSRMVHNSLIEDGLRLISNAYLDFFEKKCTEADIPCKRRLMEGKNWLEIVKDIRSNHYDLVIIGILGLGAVNGSLIGSVCERVVRKVSTDVLVVKNSRSINERIVVAIDGSDLSLSAFSKALALGKLFHPKIEVVSVYDPHFHRKAFKALTSVLCEGEGKMFKFQEQEKLHDEIIDDGLGKIYQGYLEGAVEMGIREGIEVKTALLAGKAYDEVCKYLESDPPSLLVISRFGAHHLQEQDIGNTAENLLRFAPCNVLLTHSS